MDENLTKVAKYIEDGTTVRDEKATYRCLKRDIYNIFIKPVSYTYIKTYAYNSKNTINYFMFNRDTPIIQINATYNNHYEKLLQIKFYYFREDNIPVLTYNIKKSIGQYRLWRPGFKFDISQYFDDEDNFEKFLQLILDGLNNVLSKMPNDPKSNYNISELSHILKNDIMDVLYGEFENLYQGISKFVSINPEIFTAQINARRNDFNELKEKNESNRIDETIDEPQKHDEIYWESICGAINYLLHNLDIDAKVIDKLKDNKIK